MQNTPDTSRLDQGRIPPIDVGADDAGKDFVVDRVLDPLIDDASAA